ncbi:MAG: LicD family protein [Bacilli bacterium]|nr:LicD family protein [Bacilli bacterium]
MKEINLKEHKKILVEMLDYIHNICIDNDIKYSLLGGSLIGAIRHKGIIPWDDDIDIVLEHSEYMKLIDILKKTDSKYKLLDVDSKNYLYPFAKLIDTRTVLFEDGFKSIDDYGVYLDIFEYNNFPNNKILGLIHYKIIMFYRFLIWKYSIEKCNSKGFKRLLTFLLRKINNKVLLKGYNLINRFYNHFKCDNYMSNWIAYGLYKEIQSKSFFKSFKIVKFENIDAMITEDYDGILKTSFGDYMKLPPKEKRILPHKNRIYWKD